MRGEGAPRGGSKVIRGLETQTRRLSRPGQHRTLLFSGSGSSEVMERPEPGRQLNLPSTHLRSLDPTAAVEPWQVDNNTGKAVLKFPIGDRMRPPREHPGSASW